MNLFIFFALPLATILLAIVLQKILKCPILVAITFFSIYLVVIFGLYGTGVFTNLAAGLTAIIVYTLIAFITAYIFKMIIAIRERFFENNNSVSYFNNSGNISRIYSENENNANDSSDNEIALTSGGQNNIGNYRSGRMCGRRVF